MKTKYKFEEVTGCTAFNFLVNDETFYDLPKEKQEEIVDYLLVKLKEEFKAGSVLIDQIVSIFQYDDYENDPEPCGQCGDTIQTTTWNI
jgi:hypothetical protein